MVIILLLTQIFAGLAFTASAENNTITPIKHVVVVMMENHSFDNLFGLYPTMNETNSSSLMASLQTPDDILNVSRSIAASLKQVPNNSFSTSNPDEYVYPEDWNNGNMDGFALNGGSQSMTYFSSTQLAVEWDWAQEYAMGDRYFSSCLCQTNPNRLFSLAGYAADLKYDDGPPPYISVNQTIFAELSTHGVSWGYYLKDASADIFPLNYFSGIDTYSSNIKSWSDFQTSLQSNSLPAVSWVMPIGGGASGVDQHPSSNVTQGQDWLVGIVNSVMSSPYWNSTAIFITYDEGGGYYDHVPPPIVDGVQLGFRVPFFAISPYSKENYVSNTVMNHGSILAFIDYNWKLPALNQFVADSGLPLDMFNFQNSTRAPILLDSHNNFPVAPQIPINELPYSRHGSTSTTLSSLGKYLFVPSNSSQTPSYPTTQFLVILVIVLVTFITAIMFKIHRNRRVVARIEIRNTIIATPNPNNQ